MIRDLRYALRSLKKSPGFVAVAVLSLGLGLGLVTTMFALLDGVTHPYVAYRDPERLFEIRGWFPSRNVRVRPIDIYRAVRDQTRAFDAVVPYVYETFAPDADAESMSDAGGLLYAELVPARYFDLLGVKPMLGRAPRDGDAEAGAAVIGYGMWRRRFAGRRSLRDLTLPINGRVFSVVGVMPRGMPGTVWLGMPRGAEENLAFDRYPGIIGRLRPGVSPQTAEAELAAAARRLTALYNSAGAPFGFHLTSMRAEPQQLTDAHKAMLVAALAVLLIACANLANLMLARGLSKRREIALRLAIGAGRAAVVGQMFAECVVITVGGAMVGVAASAWGVDIITNRVPHELWWLGVVLPQLSWRVFALSGLAAAVSAVLFGLLPAIRLANAVSLDEPLKDEAGTTGRTRQRYSALAVSEVALTLALLMGAGLLLKVVRHLSTYDYDFPARQLLQGWMWTPALDSATPQQRLAFELSTVAAIKAVPGVADAAIARNAFTPGGAVTAELTADSNRIVNVRDYPLVTPGYVRTMGLPVLQGRDFQEGDLTGPGAVILNTLAAVQLYPGQSPIGHMLKLGGAASNAPWVRIVGVCRTALRVTDPGDLTTGRGEPEVYVVRAASLGRSTQLLVRATGDPTPLAVVLRRRLRALVPRGNVGILEYLWGYDQTLTSRAFLADLFVTMGSFALILAAVGIYGVLAYAVNRRLREFAVRVALGAQRSDLLRSVLHDGIVMALAGTGLGAFVALWSAFLLENFLEDVYPTDVPTLVLAESVIIAVTIAASLVPAFRATRADPVEILRAT